MSDHDEVLLERAEDHVLGMLDPDAQGVVERQVEDDPSLRGLVAAYRDTLADMGYAIPVRPDAAVRDRILGRVAPDRASTVPVAAKVVRRRRVPVGFWVGLVALLAAASVIAKLVIDLRDTRELAAAAEVRVAARDLALAQRDSLIAQLSDPAIETVSLVAASGREPAVRVFVDKRRRTALLSAASIDSLPQGRAYQLWFFIAGVAVPVPSVTFNATADGTALVTGVRLPEGVITATAVTVEPDGGSPAPTSPAVFAGSFATRE